MATVDLELFSLLETLCREDRPVLACSRRTQAQGHARLPCLGLFADGELLLAFSLILARPLTLNLSCCSGCINEAMTCHLGGAVQQAMAVSGASLDSVHLANSLDDVGFQEPGLSRRELFTLFRKKTRQGSAALLERLQGDLPREFRSKGLPRSRALLLRVLAAHPDRDQAARVAAAFPNLEVQDACVGCTGCVGVCPTGALAAPNDLPGKPDFKREFCTDCGVCQVFCRPAAIQMT
jgi:ferredoxin